MLDFSLSGKVALVTGASYGIGFALAGAYAEQGATIVFNDINQDLVDRGLAAYKDAGITAHGYVCDVTDEEQVNAFVKQVTEEVGHINILVNNAGRGAIRKPFHELTTEDWRSVQEITLNSQFFMSRAFVRLCRERDRAGAIVNVLSKSAFTTNSKDNTSYICAKSGAYGLTKGVANEMAPYKIRVNGVVPGYVQTERTYPDGEPRTERMRQLLPTGAFTTPIEIGRVVAFLCSDCAGQIIGAAIDCSGGTML